MPPDIVDAVNVYSFEDEGSQAIKPEIEPHCIETCFSPAVVEPLESTRRAVVDLVALPSASVATLWPWIVIVAPSTGSPLSRTVTSRVFTISKVAPTPTST